MGVVNSKTFRSGNSEAVRLPKEVAFGADIEVTIERVGDGLMIRPRRDAAAEKRKLLAMIERLRALPAPGVLEVREGIEFPERPGL